MPQFGGKTVNGLLWLRTYGIANLRTRVEELLDDASLGPQAGAFLMAPRPSFWIEFGARLAKTLLPLAWRDVSKRMPPEEEAAWLAAERQGNVKMWLIVPFDGSGPGDR